MDRMRGIRKPTILMFFCLNKRCWLVIVCNAICSGFLCYMMELHQQTKMNMMNSSRSYWNKNIWNMVIDIGLSEHRVCPKSFVWVYLFQLNWPDLAGKAYALPKFRCDCQSNHPWLFARSPGLSKAYALPGSRQVAGVQQCSIWGPSWRLQSAMPVLVFARPLKTPSSRKAPPDDGDQQRHHHRIGIRRTRRHCLLSCLKKVCSSVASSIHGVSMARY